MSAMFFEGMIAQKHRKQRRASNLCSVCGLPQQSHRGHKAVCPEFSPDPSDEEKREYQQRYRALHEQKLRYCPDSETEFGSGSSGIREIDMTMFVNTDQTELRFPDTDPRRTYPNRSKPVFTDRHERTIYPMAEILNSAKRADRTIWWKVEAAIQLRLSEKTAKNSS